MSNLNLSHIPLLQLDCPILLLHHHLLQASHIDISYVDCLATGFCRGGLVYVKHWRPHGWANSHPFRTIVTTKKISLQCSPPDNWQPQIKENSNIFKFLSWGYYFWLFSFWRNTVGGPGRFPSTAFTESGWRLAALSQRVPATANRLIAIKLLLKTRTFSCSLW